MLFFSDFEKKGGVSTWAQQKSPRLHAIAEDKTAPDWEITLQQRLLGERPCRNEKKKKKNLWLHTCVPPNEFANPDELARGETYEETEKCWLALEHNARRSKIAARLLIVYRAFTKPQITHERDYAK